MILFYIIGLIIVGACSYRIGVNNERERIKKIVAGEERFPGEMPKPMKEVLEKLPLEEVCRIVAKTCDDVLLRKIDE
jgi:hypothetical protein